MQCEKQTRSKLPELCSCVGLFWVFLIQPCKEYMEHVFAPSAFLKQALHHNLTEPEFLLIPFYSQLGFGCNSICS